MRTPENELFHKLISFASFRQLKGEVLLLTFLHDAAIGGIFYVG